MKIADDRLNSLIMTNHANPLQNRNIHQWKIVVNVWIFTVDVINYSILESTQGITDIFHCQGLDKMHIQLSKIRLLFYKANGEHFLRPLPDIEYNFTHKYNIV